MKKKISILLALLLVWSSCLLFPASAAEGNMDGDGGSVGDGSGSNFWNGEDGVRISVIEKKTNKSVGITFDWTNYNVPSKTISFAITNKLQYLKGKSLSPNVSDYYKTIPDVALPKVINASGGSNITAVKNYFTDEGRIKAIAKEISIEYQTLISSEFTILLEPVAYFTYNGQSWAMTATEAALYDQQISGGLSKAMGYLTHQNQPLSMYLEKTEFGIAPWGGGVGVIDNHSIIQYLGIGTVNFDDEKEDDKKPPDKPAEEYDYEYHADTDVITSIRIKTNREINPDNPGRATFRLPDKNVAKEYVIPEDESQLVWIKWRTPKVDEDTVIDIPVDINGGSSDKAVLKVKIIVFDENTPPDPEGRDRNDGFKVPKPPTKDSITNLGWGEWYAVWHENWVWHSKSCGGSGGGSDTPDKSPNARIMFGFLNTAKGSSNTRKKDCGEWVDEGWWDFHWRPYNASLKVNVKMQPDDRVPTANGGNIKSGYGVNAEVSVNLSTNGGNDNTTEIQHIIATFPEFEYKTYNRHLKPQNDRVGYVAKWEFKPNEYSQVENPVHFTPIWFPDGSDYVVSYFVIDAWTPAGQLYAVVNSNDMSIDGNVYDDWHIAPDYSQRSK